jgi:hypothetical protein
LIRSFERRFRDEFNEVYPILGSLGQRYDDQADDSFFAERRDKLVELLNDVRAATKQRKNSEDRFFKRSTSEPTSEPRV